MPKHMCDVICSRRHKTIINMLFRTIPSMAIIIIRPRLKVNGSVSE